MKPRRPKSQVSDADALEVFRAGQAMLRAIHGLVTVNGLERFDEALMQIYRDCGFDHACCNGCDAEVPSQLILKGKCPNCRANGG